ncbi:hypothetical protein [Desulfobacter sp.]|uniref:hypothetical protein n=1 Tax=Desulfobacter sp. TaxID=2294 RepID=UPI003D0E99F1
MDQFKKHRESVRIPISLRIYLSLFIGFIFLGGLVWMMYPMTQNIPAVFPSLIFVLVVSVVAFILVSLFYKVSIRITKKLMATTGDKEIVLSISGVKTEGASYIICKNIQAMAVRPYSVSGFASINPFFPRKGNLGEQVIALPGHHGEGVLLKYSYETVFGHKKKIHTIFFPTNDAHHLVEILKSIIGYM